METIRVVLADDHPVLRSGVRSALDRAPGIEVVGEGSDGEDALRLAQELRPDVLLLDMEMPRKPGVEVARELTDAGSPVRVLALSAYDDEEYVLGLLSTGAAGYLTKEEAPQTIVEAVRGVARGEEGWLSRRATARVVRQTGRSAQGSPRVRAPMLSERELEVLRLLAKGSDNTRIAAVLYISEGTVKNHITNIYAKAGLRSRAEAVAWAWQSGLARRGSVPGRGRGAGPLVRRCLALVWLASMLGACGGMPTQAPPTATSQAARPTAPDRATNTPEPVYTVVAGVPQEGASVADAPPTSAAAAPPDPTPTSTPTPLPTATPTLADPAVRDVRLLRNGADPVSAGGLTVFRTTDTGIRLAGAVTDAGPETQLGVVWRLLEAPGGEVPLELRIGLRETAVVEGSRPFEFVLGTELPAPPGLYEATLTLAGRAVEERRFRLVAPPPPVLAGPSGRIRGAPRTAPPPIRPTNVQFIVDASGSMNERVGSVTRMAAARDALRALIRAIPRDPSLNVGLRAYAHRYGSGKERSCADTELLVPMRGVDQAALQRRAGELRAVGAYTPISRALERAAADFRRGEARNVAVLVSDGQETCVAEPVPPIRAAAQRAGLTVHVVGFDIGDEEARRQLGAIARATGGIYADADSPKALAAALRAIAAEQVRILRVRGGRTGQLMLSPPARVRWGEYAVRDANGEKVAGETYASYETSASPGVSLLPGGTYTVEWSAVGGDDASRFRVSVAEGRRTVSRLGALRILSAQKPHEIVLVDRATGLRAETDATALSRIAKTGLLDAPLAIGAGEYAVYFRGAPDGEYVRVATVRVRAGAVTELEV